MVGHFTVGKAEGQAEGEALDWHAFDNSDNLIHDPDMGRKKDMTLRLELRAARGLRQLDVAERAGISAPAVSRLENKRESYNYTIQTAQLVADALGVHLYELYGYEYPPPWRTNTVRAKLHGLIDQLDHRNVQVLMRVTEELLAQPQEGPPEAAVTVLLRVAQDMLKQPPAEPPASAPEDATPPENEAPRPPDKPRRRR